MIGLKIFVPVLLCFGCNSHWDNNINLSISETASLDIDKYLVVDMQVHGTSHVPFSSVGPMDVTQISSGECADKTICSVLIGAKGDFMPTPVKIVPHKTGSTNVTITVEHPWRKKSEDIRLSLTVKVPATLELKPGTKIENGWDQQLILKLEAKNGTAPAEVVLCSDSISEVFLERRGFSWKQTRSAGLKFMNCQFKESVIKDQFHFADSRSASTHSFQRMEPEIIACLAVNEQQLVTGLKIFRSVGNKLEVLDTRGSLGARLCSQDT